MNGKRKKPWKFLFYLNFNTREGKSSSTAFPHHFYSCYCCVCVVEKWKVCKAHTKRIELKSHEKRTRKKSECVCLIIIKGVCSTFKFMRLTRMGKTEKIKRRKIWDDRVSAPSGSSLLCELNINLHWWDSCWNIHWTEMSSDKNIKKET